MKVFELKLDGTLTREIIREFGEPLALDERLRNKVYGLGNLLLEDGYDSVLQIQEQESDTVRTNFEWTKKGAIFRLRTMSKLFAYGIRNEEIESITLTKTQDYAYAVPFFPLWILLKLGVKISIARWFRFNRFDRVLIGSTIIQIRMIDGQILTYQTEGNSWNKCIQVFNIARMKDRVILLDKRTKISTDSYYNRK